MFQIKIYSEIKNIYTNAKYFKTLPVFATFPKLLNMLVGNDSFI